MPALAQLAARGSIFSGEVLPMLILVLAVSSAVYWFLVWRCTGGRRAAVLNDWAAAHGFRLNWRHHAPVPAVLERLTDRPPHVCVSLSSKSTFIAQLELTGRTDAAGQATASRWNVLVRQISGDWPTSGFRPAVHVQSLLEFFPMGSYPSLAPPERFLVQGTDTAAAHVLAASPARGLLPADVGLLVRGPWMVLDFSTRPFDTIELTRMQTLADQIAANLPPVG